MFSKEVYNQANMFSKEVYNQAHMFSKEVYNQSHYLFYCDFVYIQIPAAIIHCDPLIKEEYSIIQCLLL